jgi:hypothetical protein
MLIRSSAAAFRSPLRLATTVVGSHQRLISTTLPTNSSSSDGSKQIVGPAVNHVEPHEPIFDLTLLKQGKKAGTHDYVYLLLFTN